jgi:hypothetical protein
MAKTVVAMAASSCRFWRGGFFFLPALSPKSLVIRYTLKLQRLCHCALPRISGSRLERKAVVEAYNTTQRKRQEV